MNALGAEIAALIAEDGPISLERFMTLAALHPRYGYYRTRKPIGAEGDFITAPEIHQMFGELLGLWAIEMWRQMNEPAPLRLIELGPGRGTLMADFLRAARLRPAFVAALDIHLVEAGAALREEQKQRLADCGAPVSWHESLDTLPQGAAIIIANEFFDALPVRHYVQTSAGLCERVIGRDDEGGLCFGLVPATGLPLRTGAVSAEGAILEIGVAAQSLMRRLAARFALAPGALLVIDYGYSGPGAGATLQALQRHRPVDPLAAPGEADLTAHVDFAALARAAEAEGAAVHGPVTQGTFLARLGIFERAAILKRKATPAQAADIDAALARLALPGPSTGPDARMADLFKVLAVTSAGLPAPPGFAKAGEFAQ